MPQENNQSQQPGLSSERRHPEPCQYRKVTPLSGIYWLTQAWSLFRSKPGTWLSCMLLMTLIMTLLPVAQVASPIFTAGLMYACSQLKQKRDFNLGLLFYGFSNQFPRLAYAGLIYVGCVLVCYFIAENIAAQFGFYMPLLTPELAEQLKVDPVALKQFLIAFLLITLIMLALLLPALMAFWFAPVLIILKDIPVIDSLKLSFHACLCNIKAFTLYGLAGLAFIIMAIMLLSLLAPVIPKISILLVIFATFVFMGIFYASIYTSFEDIFIDSEINPDSTNNPHSIIV